MVAFFHEVIIENSEENKTFRRHNQISTNHLPRPVFSLVRRNIFLTPVRKCENSTKIREISVTHHKTFIE